MKSIIKKYPKRIIIMALVVLLIAVVGTVNNYRTYRGESNRMTSAATYRYLESIYGEGRIVFRETSGSAVFCEYGNGYINLVPQLEIKDLSSVVQMTLDSESYSPGDTVVATIHKFGRSSLEFDSDKYILQVLRDGRWYSVHTGEIGAENESEPVKLPGGESWEFSVRLDSIREVSDELIKLKKGQYRICKEVSVTSRSSSESFLDIWLACEFEVE